jgi:hypothetical protein
VQATTTQGSGIDLDAIVAIDVHTHAEVSALFHTGQTGIGGGAPGGAGIRLKYSNPMEVDDEALAVPTHKPLGLEGS